MGSSSQCGRALPVTQGHFYLPALPEELCPCSHEETSRLQSQMEEEGTTSEGCKSFRLKDLAVG